MTNHRMVEKWVGRSIVVIISTMQETNVKEGTELRSLYIRRKHKKKKKQFSEFKTLINYNRIVTCLLKT